MRIMLKETKPSGAFYNIQSCGSSAVPDGFYEVADGVELSCGGFGTLTVVDGVVTSFVCNTEAWEAWKASLPEPIPPEPTLEEKNRADIDYLAIITGVDL